MGFFGKLVVIAAVVIGVLIFWRWWTREEREAAQARHDAARRQMAGDRQAKHDSNGAKVPFWRRARAPDRTPAAPLPVEDMAACAICGAFVAADAPRCQHSACPRP